MAKVNFNNMQDDSAYSTTNNNGNDVGFFTLRNDNDEAIVRFMCDSTDDFEILTVHDIKVGDKFRKINCIRDFKDPVENCPLCASGTKINQRFFIKLLQYDKTTDPSTGMVTVTPKAMIWERSTAYAKTLKSYLDNYGPLSDVICKVIRHGKAGDMQTTYEIVPNLNKAIYKDEVYVKDASLFGDFNAFGTIVMDKSYEEIMQFQMTGQFPVREKTETNTGTSVLSTPQMTPSVNQGYAPSQFNATAQPAQSYGYTGDVVQQTTTSPQFNTAAPQQFTQPVTQTPVVNGGTNNWGQPTPRATMPWDNNSTQNNNGGFERPRRY